MGSRSAMTGLGLALSLSWAPGAHAADKAQCLGAYESAQRHKNVGELKAARKDLLVCVEAECPALLRADCSAWMTEVERSMPTVVLVARAGEEEVRDVRVLVDGKLSVETLEGSALEVDPGTHVFRFEAVGLAPVEKSVTLRPGEKNREVSVQLPAETRPASGPPVVSYVLAGVGVVGLAGFTYFGLSGLGGRSDLEDCKGHCPQGDVDDVQADFIRADVSLAVAALAFGGAAYFYFGAPSEQGPPRARLGIRPRAAGVESSIHVAF